MGQYNRVILLGNCTRDVEVKYSQSGNAYAQWGIAVNRNRKNKDTGEKQEETCFIDLKAFGITVGRVYFVNHAEIAGEYLKKGSPVFVEGRLTQYKWDDENGNPRSKHSVTIESLQLLPTRNGQQAQTQEESLDESTMDDIPF
ncbi:MAG: single-stranded DNA-binding protein [Candidatus Poribacteria bacterium]